MDSSVATKALYYIQLLILLGGMGMSFENGENIVAWQVKGKPICSRCLDKGEIVDHALTEGVHGWNDVIACARCGEILCDDLEYEID
jgi:hypothetical protein